MNICKIDVSNFRGIKNASILVSKNAVFVGDNNSGKSTLFEAIDLVMGPDRLSRSPVIDEHDFYAGEYLANDTPVQIKIEVTVIGLSEDQKIYFGNHIEWWDRCKGALISGPPASSTDVESVEPALRLAFQGNYNLEEDDFEGQTYFAETLREGSTPELFRKKDKRNCGFLYLRTLRTGSRALSLGRGSLLDIILQMKEVKPQMWEDVLKQLKGVSVANESELGVSDILTSVQDSLSNIVSYEAADKPQIKVSNLTREHLRKVLTVFMGSGAYREDGTEYLTPYTHQGTGTVNTLVLSLLSIIADIKENVIFAMEEPEIALPPHIQKRVISTVIEKSTQALFTSHSPYVIEEFPPDQILVISKTNGDLTAAPAGMPPTVKMKAYREEMRRRFCESLLARRVLIVEGRTEYDVYSTAAKKLQRLHPERNCSFDLLGIALVQANTDTQVAPLGEYYKKMGKTVYAIFDKQDDDVRKKIEVAVDYMYEATEHGIEDVVLKGVNQDTLLKYGLKLVKDNEWPSNLSTEAPRTGMEFEKLYKIMKAFFKHKKGDGSLAELIEYCSESEMPKFITETIFAIEKSVYSLQAVSVMTEGEV